MLYLVTGSNCKYCGVMRSRLAESKLDFEELRIEDDHEIVKKANLMGLPQLIITNDSGKIKDAFAGTVTIKELERFL